MFARPSKRDRFQLGQYEPPKEGSFLHKILKKTPLATGETKKRRVLYESDYLKALERNNTQLGIPYKEPAFIQYQPPPPREEVVEPDLPWVDRVYLNLKFLKSGVVRVKVVTNFLELYQNYYKRALRPPLKLITAAYKARGFSKGFLENIKVREQKMNAFSKKVPSILEKIFEKEPVKKVKRKPRTPPPEEEDEPPQPTEEEEDNFMDVEPDEPEEDVVEEDYFSEADV